MLLSDLLRPDSILLDIDAPDREGAIGRLVEALGLPGTAADRETLRAQVLEREAAGSTAMGNGIAIPHARTSRVGAPRLAIGKLRRPLDFGAPDGRPVRWLFLLAVPESDPKAHLKTLAALSRFASDKILLEALDDAENPQEVYELLAAITV